MLTGFLQTRAIEISKLSMYVSYDAMARFIRLCIGIITCCIVYNCPLLVNIVCAWFRVCKKERAGEDKDR